MKYLLYENGTIIITSGFRPAGRKTSELAAEARKAKTFEIGTRGRRQIQCAAIRLWHKKKHSLKFITLTFSNPVGQKEANKALSKYLDNLKKTYELAHYIIIKEDHKSGVPHFHCILDIPFQHYTKLNYAWNCACRDIMRFSNNALTSGDQSVINDIRQVAYYVSKYVTKSNAGSTETRRYFYSRSLKPQPKAISFGRYIDLINTYSVKKHVEKEFFSVTFLKHFADLPEKFALIPVEKPLISVKKSSKSKKIPFEIPFIYRENSFFIPHTSIKY